MACRGETGDRDGGAARGDIPATNCNKKSSPHLFCHCNKGIRTAPKARRKRLQRASVAQWH